jgi:AhpD family alkylhydroperoxidase
MATNVSGTQGSIYTEAVKELVALGASIVANCEPCFKYHFDQARKLGVSRADMAAAVETAQMVKDAPADAVSKLADRYHASGSSITDAVAADAPCCCPPSSSCP